MLSSFNIFIQSTCTTVKKNLFPSGEDYPASCLMRAESGLNLQGLTDTVRARTRM